MQKVWSKRWGINGWRWKVEYEGPRENAERWLSECKNDEPHVTFKMNKTRPKD